MRTTVRLDGALLERARDEARRRGETLTSLIERGLRLVLANPETRSGRRKVNLITSKSDGGVLPGIELNDSARLLDVLELPPGRHSR